MSVDGLKCILYARIYMRTILYHYIMYKLVDLHFPLVLC